MGSAAYEHGRDAGRQDLAPSLNPYPNHSCDFVEWHQGWFREQSARQRGPRPAPARIAQILPHPQLTAEQCDLVCARSGLALGRLGRDRFVLIPLANPFDFA